MRRGLSVGLAVFEEPHSGVFEMRKLLHGRSLGVSFALAFLACTRLVDRR